MESFLDRIKRDMENVQRRAGQREDVVVNTRALQELIHHFERLDSYERATHTSSRNQHINEQLHNLITASYENQGKRAEKTLMIIMDTLRPLMECREKSLEITARFDR